MTQHRLRIGNWSIATPGDESVRTNQHGALGRDTVRRRPALFEIRQISRRADAVALQSRRDGARELARTIRPPAAGRSRREHPAAAEEIDRGAPLAVAL